MTTRMKRKLTLALGMVVLLGAAAFAATTLRSEPPPVIDSGPAPQVTESTGPASAASEPFPAFWPAHDRATALLMQEQADQGKDAWRKDPREVAVRFIDEFTGWGSTVELDGNTFPSGVDVKAVEEGGDSSRGWSATVSFQRYRQIDQQQRPLGSVDTVSLIGLRGFQDPVWFVSGLESPQVKVEQPSSGANITSPTDVSGQGVGYEATIVVELREDVGRSLVKTFVNSGSTEVAPFRGQISFSSAVNPSGILLLSSDQGAEGPPISMTIVRVHFGSVQTKGQQTPSEITGETRNATVYLLTSREDGLHLTKEIRTVRKTPRVATDALEELLHGDVQDPRNYSPFPRATRLLSLTISDRIATVDLSAEVLTAPSGATQESLGIQMVVWTLTEFPTIEKVRFTVEGKASGQASNGRSIENWWGHEGLSGQPFARNRSLKIV